jgi:hypothetical protein
MTRTMARLLTLLVVSPFVLVGQSFAAHTVTMETLNPFEMTAGTPVLVTASVRVGVEPTLIRNSIRLLKVTEAGSSSVLCSMFDEGTNGDVVAGDNLFTCRFTINETQPIRLFLRASVAYLGEIQRTLSPPVPFSVLATTSAADSRAILAQALLAGNLTIANRYAADGLAPVLAALNANDRAALAAALANCSVIEQNSNFQICIDPGGMFRFTMAPDDLNIWRVLVW